MSYLIPVNEQSYTHVRALFDLLGERKSWQSISHKNMPTWEEHIDFVQSHPYRDWWLIQDRGKIIGAAYLTRNNEIGIGVFVRYQGQDYASEAIKEIMERYSGHAVFANINPENEPSIKLFEKLGFEKIQVTYRHE